MKTLFVGTRCAVFEAASQLGARFVKVIAPAGSPLASMASESGTRLVDLLSKTQLVDEIANADFELLISNGCPFILPVSRLKKRGQRFINVHPSLLPNLKGKHPVNGAVLYNQPLGATCHEMDDGIDTGPVIARVHVDVDGGADVGLLYRLAFLAEGDAYRKAHANGFAPGGDELGLQSEGMLYFNRTDESMRINFTEPIELTVRRISAFSVPGQMARFRYRDHTYMVARASRVVSGYMEQKYAAARPNSIVIGYDDTVVVKLNDGYLRLSGVAGAETLHEGTLLA